MNRRDLLKYTAALVGSSSLGISSGWATKTFLSPIESSNFSVDDNLCRDPSIAQAQFSNVKTHPDILSFTGSRLVKNGFLDELASSYAIDFKKQIKVLGGNCDSGIRSVQTGLSYFGSICCPVNGSPAEGLGWLPVAEDLKVVLTHPENPITSLSMDELKAIVRGEIKRWNEVGGDNSPIALVVDRHCPHYSEPVRQLLLDGEPYPKTNVLTARNDSTLLRALTRFRSSIGVNSWIISKPLVDKGLLKAIPINNKTATIHGEIDSSYPLRGPFNLVFKRWEPSIMEPFIKYLYGSKGQRIIGRNLKIISFEEALEVGHIPESKSNPIFL